MTYTQARSWMLMPRTLAFFAGALLLLSGSLLFTHNARATVEVTHDNGHTTTGQLEVKKVFAGDPLPDGIKASNFSFTYDKQGGGASVTKPFNEAGDVTQDVAVGAYDVSEPSVPDNYTVTYSSNQPGHENDCGNLSVGHDQNSNQEEDGEQNQDYKKKSDNHGPVICTITNTYVAPKPTTGTIEITKYSCPADTVVNRTDNGVDGTVPAGCTLMSGATFGYVHGDQTDANAPYPELNGTLTAGGSTNDSGVLNITNLPSEGRYLIEETDANNQKLADDGVLGLYCEGDGDSNPAHNDNQELTFVPADGVAKCVAYNPAQDQETPKSCTLVSDTTTLVGDSSAALTYVHPNWTHGLDASGAKWIWNALYASPSNATDEVVTFSKTFNVIGTPSSVILDLAADNYYSVSVNGNASCSDATHLDNFTNVEPPCDITSLVHSGVNTLTFTVTNAKGFGTDPKSNPGGLIYRVTIDGSSCTDVPQEPITSTIKLCKYDGSGKGLSGWTLMLKGSSVGSVNVAPNGTNFTIPNVPAGSYVVEANGAYIYRPGSPTASTSDAAYSLRLPGDSVYGGPYAPWVRENDFPTPYAGWLGIILNDSFTDWGSVFSPLHAYALGTTTSGTSDFNFKILDDQYSDNSGSLSVNVSHGYVGVTGDDGCVMFDNVPYGSYTTSEIPQDGWTNVSGNDAEVTVDAPTKTFTLVNRQGDGGGQEPEIPSCDSTPETPGFTTFDTFSLGNVNGQNNWKSTGAYDQEIVPNTYGYPTFGCKSLRLSNAVTSGSFGDQTFAAPTAEAAGESSSGAPNDHYEAQFDIASTMLDEQPGLSLSVSPDDGNGSRMSYLSFTDTPSGIHVIFYDVQGTGNPANFVPTDLGTLSRSAPHTIKFVIDFVDGPSNDVVKIFIDGSLVHTGTTWENYYRYDSEQGGNENQLFPIDTLIFRAGGTAAPSTSGEGYLFDNLSLHTSNPGSESQENDLCTNIEGPQESVPAGYHRIYDGRCIKNGGGSTTTTYTSGGGGGSVLGESTTTEPTPEPQVLGEACGLYMDKFLRFGHADNDVGQTTKLQAFLNKWMNAGLPVTGFFGPLTNAAVKNFQNKYSDEILKPWNIPGPTGLVYLTTLREINLLECPELSLEVPPLVVWSSNPNAH